MLSTISDPSVSLPDHSGATAETGSESTTRQRRKTRRLLGLCALLILGSWALQATPYLNPANDAGRYMVLGESLAQTGDLRLLNQESRPLDTLYPPGFPAIIAF